MNIPFLSLHNVTAKYKDEIHEAVLRVVDSGWYLQGKENEQFEQHYAEYIGTKHCIGCANGLDALIWIFRAYIELGVIQPGDEVIVPANTYIASILAITDNGLKPVFVEPNRDTLQIDDEQIEQAITAKTRAVMIVHLYGRCAYTERIGELCERYNLLLIEDNAQAHGCHYREKRTGSLGHAAGHSFYPGKNLGALGDAGCVTTDDDELAGVIRALGNYGSEEKYVFKYAGYNSRIDELQAAVLAVKLKHLDEDNRHRADIADMYYKGLANPLVRLPQHVDSACNVYHLFPVFCEERDRLQQYLREQGIETLIHYPIAPHRQECYREYAHLSLPVTEEIHRTELSLPIGPTMTLKETWEVVNAINNFK